MPVIQNKSKAYNYNYTSLADIVSAGLELPKMRIKATDNGEYIEYLDDKGEWQTGARIVVPNMTDSNDAQKYGAAISYARRFTAQLALQIATTDDQAVETQSKQQADDNIKADKQRLDFDSIQKKLDGLKTQSEVNSFAKEVSAAYPDPTDKQRMVIKTMFETKREKLTMQRLTYREDS